MKNHPFKPWGVPDMLIDRKEEQKFIENFLEQIEKGNSWILVIRGEEGMGKGVLLRVLEKKAQAKKMAVCSIRTTRIKNEKDLINEIKTEISGLAKENDISEKIIQEYARQEYENMVALIEKTKKMFKERRVIIIIEDFEKIKKHENLLKEFETIVSLMQGVGIVLSSTRKIALTLGSLLIDLKPVNEEDYAEYIEKMTKDSIKMGEECIKAVYRESGGSPKLLQFITWYLYENAKENDKIITQAHYLASRRAILSMLSKEWFAELYYNTSPAERKALGVVARFEEASVGEIAKALGWKEGPTVTILMRLAEKGNLIKKRRGTYSVFSPLYKKFIEEREKM